MQPNTQKLKKYLIFIVVFALIKLLVFLTPISVSNLATDTSTFGKFEYQIGMGLLWGNLLTLGMAGVYPYYVITLQRDKSGYIFFAHGLLLTALAILGVLIFLVVGIPSQLINPVLLAIIFGQQFLLSSIYKTNEENVYAVLVDGGVYLTILISVGSWILIGNKITSASIDLIWLPLIGYSAFLGVRFFKEFIRNYQGPFSIREYVKISQRGISLMASGLLVYLLTTNTRVYIEHFATYQDVGVFSFYFRIATSVVMIQQVVNIVFFRKIFESDLNRLDKYLSVFLAFIFMLSMAVFIIFPVLGKGWFRILDETYPRERTLFFLVCVQMSFWICMSFLEGILNRLNLIKGSITVTGIYVVLMLFVIHLLHTTGKLNLDIIVATNAGFIFLATEFQFLLITKRKKFGFRYTRVINYLIASAAITGFFLFG